MVVAVDAELEPAGGPGAVRIEQAPVQRGGPEGGQAGPSAPGAPDAEAAQCGEAGHWLAVRLTGKNGAPAAVTLQSALIQKL